MFISNLFNYMLLWFFPLALLSVLLSLCMLHVLAARNVWGYLVFMISDLCTFVKIFLGSRFG